MENRKRKNLNFPILAVSIITFILISTSVFTSQVHADEIYLYGRHGCGLCRSMMNQLDNAGIDYTFCDIDNDQSRNQEMWNHIRRAHPNTSNVMLPVMVVNGNVLISPSFNEVRSLLSEGAGNNSNQNTNTQTEQGTPISIGDSISAQLDPRDSTDNGGRYYDIYTLNIRQSGTIVIELSSSQFDTYLSYSSPSGQIQENDDINYQGGNTNSRLELSENSSGNATITVTSYNQGATGQYSLSITRQGQQRNSNAGQDNQIQQQDNYSGTSGQSWNQNMYSQYTWQTFKQYGPANATVDPDNINYDLLNAALFYETNRMRAQNNMQPFVYHNGCQQAAQLHAQDMVTQNFFSHTNPSNSAHRSMTERVAIYNVQWWNIGENIAAGDVRGTYNQVAEFYLDIWMNSPGHRANILNQDFTHLGTGAVNEGGIYGLNFKCVQVFVRPR